MVLGNSLEILIFLGTVLVIVFNLIFSILILLHGRRDKSEVFYSLISFFAGVWSFATIIVSFPYVLPEYFRESALTHYLAGDLAYLSFFCFAVCYISRPANRLWLSLAVGAANLSVLILSLVYNDFLFLVEKGSNGSEIISFNMPGYALFVITLSAVFLLTELFLVKKYRFSEGVEKSRLKYLLIGTMTAGSIGIILNLILPWFGIFYFFSKSPILVSLSFTGMSFYILMRYELFNIRIIATEIFVVFLIIFLFIKLFLSQNFRGLPLDLSFFSFFAIFGILLIRAAVREIKNQEKISELAEELRKSNDELKRFDAAKSEFISIASHQLRSPLTAVKGYISILLEGTFGRLTAGQIEALHKIYVSTEHLIKLIDDLLNLSRIESGRMQYDFKKINLLDIAKEVIDEYAPNLEKKHLRVIITEPNFSIPSVNGDSDKVRQVILNLIDNAIRYTDIGGAEVRFYLKKVAGKDYLGVVVEDSGRGIEKEDIEHLFTKFVRAERTRKLYTEGSGLGLYVAKKIIDDHQGRIYVESEGIGKGSSFFVELPITA